METPEEARAAQRDQERVLRGADKLERYEQQFKERAVELVQSEGIEVKDPKDILRAAEVVEKRPQQVSYACKAILKIPERQRNFSPP